MFFILAVAAAIGSRVGYLVLIFRRKKSINIETFGAKRIMIMIKTLALWTVLLPLMGSLLAGFLANC